MPPKRPSLQEDPPSASSSSEEEVENSEEEEQGSEAEESEEEEEEDESVKPTQPSLKIPKSNPIPKPPSSEDDDDDDDDEDEAEEEKTDLAADTEDSDTGSDSDSDSDSDNEPVKHMIAPRNAPVSDAKPISSDVKPISSKSMAEVPKSKKIFPTPVTTLPPKGSSVSSRQVEESNKEEKKDKRRKKKEEEEDVATVPPPKVPAASAKRPLEETNKEEKTDKRRKKKNVSDLEVEEDNHTEETDDNKTAADDGKKKRFQKLWYEDDEIDLLNGLKDFKEKGHNVSDMTAFSEFVKDSLNGEFNKSQIHSKVSRLHKTFNRLASKAKNGKEPVISVPHELKKYNIAKRIWGEQISKDNGVEENNVGNDLSVADGKKRKNNVSSNGAASPKRNVSQLPINSPKVEQKMEAEDNGTGSEYLYLNQSLRYPNYPTLPVPPQGLTNCIAMKGWDLMGSSNAELFDHKWKAVLIAETKAYLERLDVVRDQTKSMLDALETSDV